MTDSTRDKSFAKAKNEEATITQLRADNAKLVEEVKKQREFAVLFISFIGRDENTDRLPRTLADLMLKATEADRRAQATLATALADAMEASNGH